MYIMLLKCDAKYDLWTSVIALFSDPMETVMDEYIIVVSFCNVMLFAESYSQTVIYKVHPRSRQSFT